MKAPGLLLFAMVFLVCAVASANTGGEYRVVQVESLKVAIDSEWNLQVPRGYLPVRLDITNLGNQRVIDIIGSGYSGQGRLTVRQTLDLKRGDRLRLTIPTPFFAEPQNIQFQIRERGRTLESFSSSGFRSVNGIEDPVLIVANPSSPIGVAATSWLRTNSSASGVLASLSAVPGTTAAPRLDFILEPPRLPANWLGFTSLRAVLIGPTEWEQLTEAHKSALLTWTACGGDLIFVDGDLKTLLPGTDDGAAEEADGNRPAQPYFFGQIYFPKSDDISANGLNKTLSAFASAHGSGLTLPANHAPDWGQLDERGFRLAIPGVNGVPAGAYMLISIVFTLLIGPVNYLLLWRKRQQVLLVLTVPLISAVFILLLLGYAVAGEGFGVRGRAETFTLLDQVRKQAATRATVSLYAAGMAPSGGLRFSRDVAVFPIIVDPRTSTQWSVDLTATQQFSEGFIDARAPSNFEEIGFRAARERLSFAREDGGFSVVNGLGARIEQLFYRKGGNVYTLGGPLRPAEKAILQTGRAHDPEMIFTDPVFRRKFDKIISNPVEGSYLAVLERSPFWEPGVQNLEERGSFHLVLGYTEGQP